MNDLITDLKTLKDETLKNLKSSKASSKVIFAIVCPVSRLANLAPSSSSVSGSDDYGSFDAWCCCHLRVITSSISCRGYTPIW